MRIYTEDDFKNVHPDDKIYIDSKDGAFRNFYFRSVSAGILNYKDLNFKEHSIEISETSEIYPIP
ncbi:hypothetical protein SAMN03159304_01534 [Pseudomonas sp. NFACC24-1]|nr:hypothetical protein SAMN03159304_01534 [Pseudomonas sp. NFACC24-1]